MSRAPASSTPTAGMAVCGSMARGSRIQRTRFCGVLAEPAGDVDPVGEAFQRRPDAGIRARYARNKVAGAAAIVPDQLPALPRIAGGERLVLGQRPLAGCQQDEDQAGERASHREPI